MCHSFWGGFHKGWLEVGMPCIAVSILHFRCTLFRFIQGTGKHSLEDGSGREIKADAETRKKKHQELSCCCSILFQSPAWTLFLQGIFSSCTAMQAAEQTWWQRTRAELLLK